MKLWKDMTPEEKGALLLAHHEGRDIEYYSKASEKWVATDYPVWVDSYAYRVKPEPKKPREFWLEKNEYGIIRAVYMNSLFIPARDTNEIIHVREVLE